MSHTANIGRHLRELHQLSKIDDARFAAFLGIDEQALMTYETNPERMRASHIRRACDLFQTDFDEMAAEELPERVLNVARLIADLDEVDAETLETLANVGRIAGNLLEMRKIATALTQNGESPCES